MSFKLPKIKHTKLAVTILTLLLLMCIFFFYYIFYVSYSAESFINTSLKIAKQNQVSVFQINKILLYSSANALHNDEDNSLQNLNICQYTDIALYIDNTSSNSELTTQNTVKELWIDNININTNNLEIGKQVMNYKNLNSFGKFDTINNSNDRIDFNIVNTNEENDTADYTSPTFYADCSNPISLGYLNKNIVENYSIHDDVNSVIFNGKILEQAGVNLTDISFNLKFDIHIKNYDDNLFVYHANMDVNLDTESKEIFGGYLYQSKNNTSGSEYVFFREIQ